MGYKGVFIGQLTEISLEVVIYSQKRKQSWESMRDYFGYFDPGGSHRRLIMAKIQKDDEREKRILMEIIVDAYGPEEQALGWYYYLQDKLSFPFTAVCITERLNSPLRIGEMVEILDMAPEEECEHEMFVVIDRKRRHLAIPLVQVVPVDLADEQTKQGIADWHYWIAQGYEL
jgi:hypothetical protein